MNFIKKSAVISLGAVLGLTLAIVSTSNRLILTRNFFAENGQHLAALPGQDMLLFAGLQKWIYVLTALYLLFKLCLISLILYTALYIADHLLSYWHILLIVSLCEGIFLVAAAVKMWWFHYYYPHGTLLQWHQLYILSSLSLFPAIPAAWYYPLQTLNAFEVAYWFLLAFGVYRFSGLDYRTSFKIILLSYLPALFIWTVVVCFCTIMYFPGQG
ncbi:hypothetical protein [Mucilaginibacter terrae]|uniref:DUF4271 domain-containing protein n=1 Tax=Mucilaginibacter terrae TaxID=1955052 RepID=A0ABU3GNE0_9SPHI|nr:hypothetical protein [Mucilaginibacter terrae]MDT3401262.1 hypothetical protein [Mucilaginibacter terrae]